MSSTDQLAYILQCVGYRAVVGFPYLTTYIHLLLSAIFPIYTGAHASLSRPSSAAKPAKGTKKRDDDFEEQEHTMEGLGPIDALLLPLVAGLVLASLYFLIKWLEDPALLNKILNWYFAVFGVWSLARMFRDGMSLATSFVFPQIYDKDGNIWEVDAKHRRYKLVRSPSVEQRSAVSGPSSTLLMPSKATDTNWALRELLSRQLDMRVYIHRVLQAHLRMGPQGIVGLFLAIAALLYFNLAEKPWWLTNLLGFSFAYSSLQIMSPTTSWTGTLILGALFVYDIYFVFFTPVMVTVATQLDIPVKLLFPRPTRPSEDPERALFMLGLGDIILPGMMIGFALRFDLYLFYLRKQTQRAIKNSVTIENGTNDQSSKRAGKSDVVKATWHTATGGWGERFWTPKNDLLGSKRFKGIVFPKTYFRASLIGYFLAMICTLVVMDIYGHAQPALLYLVPGVLGSLWGTALVKGDIKALWVFDESEHDQGQSLPSKSEKQDSDWNKDPWTNVDWKSLFLSSLSTNASEKSKFSTKNNKTSNQASKGPSRGSTPSDKETTSGHCESTGTQTSDHESKESKNITEDRRKMDNAAGAFDRDRKTELIFLSINLPKATSVRRPRMAEEDTSPVQTGRKDRAKP